VERLGKLRKDEALPCCDRRSGWWSEEEMKSSTGCGGRGSVGEGWGRFCKSVSAVIYGLNLAQVLISLVISNLTAIA
jgi:hypothetical protein